MPVELPNFLPSNIGGDVIRVRDTARAAGSKTLATTVILIDRGLGLIGLVLLAALGAMAAARIPAAAQALGGAGRVPVPPARLWAGLVAAATVWHLAVIVPISFVVQMIPVSVNGFGVREATFSVYFSRLGLPIEGAVLLSLVATVVMMAFSLTGAVAYVARGGPPVEAEPELPRDLSESA